MNIRIIAMPPGQAPESVRKEWIGLELPVQENAAKGAQRGALGGKPENLGGYSVDGGIAIDLLLKKSRIAADWWLANIPTIRAGSLVFKREVCEVIE